ncbi:MAG: BamA/TamA family outer membrane protein [Myxococcaceae bacterium]
MRWFGPAARSFFAACALLGAACATVPPTPDAKEIDAFDIEGEKQLSESDLKDKLLTTESSWLPGWFPGLGHTEWFDENAWQADLRRIQRVYEANGFYQARVLEDVITEPKPKHVKLLVKLREGEAARVNTLDIVGLEELPKDEQAALIADLPVQTGTIFLEDDWGRTKSLLGSRLRELGFAEASVAGEALVDAEAARVDLTITVVPGIRYKLGNTFVVPYPGARIPAKYIAETSAPDLVPGTPFSEEALSKAQARVLQMGIFAGVRVNRGLPDRKAGTVPIVIDAREAPFHSVRLGGGIGGDLIRQEARAIFEYTNRDLGLSRLFSADNRLDRLTLKAKLGLAFLPNIVDVIRATPLSKWGPTWRAYLEYEVPRVFGQRTVSYQLSADLNRTLDNTYNYDALELKTGLVWRPRIDLSIFPSLNWNGFLLYTPIELRETVPFGAVGCPQFPNVCWVGFAQITTEFDKRDNKLEPKEGYYIALDLVGGLSSTHRINSFLKVTPEARGYVSFGKKKQFTVAARVKAGSLFAPDNETPIVVRYFSGGANMRGFYQRRLSPLVAIPPLENGVPNVDKGTTLPLGGAGLLEGALELRWQLGDKWVLALFNDWGLVTEQPLFVASNLGQSLYTAVGLGVRYRTPLGPIRVDLGFRLPFVGGAQKVSNLASSDGGAVQQVVSTPGCFFGLGSGLPISNPTSVGPAPAGYAGSPDNLCSAHLSIGEAF